MTFSGHLRIGVCLAFTAHVALVSGGPVLAGKLIDAVKLRDVAQVRSLLATGENLREKVQGDYPINIAALFGPAEMVALLLDAGADIEQPGRNGLHPLHNAVLSGKSDIVALLIARGAMVDSRDRQGRTPLLNFAAIAASNLDIARMLLAAGADPEVEESLDQLRALDFAAISGEVALASLLLAHKSDVNHRQSGSYGETALMHAVFHNQKAFVQYLIGQGADVNITNRKGESALSYAKGNLEIQQLLIAAGAK